MRRNASPRWEYKGTKDVGSRQAIIIPEQMPQHLPVAFTYASTGPYDEVVYGYGDIFNTIFGSDLLNYRGKHVTHVLPLIDMMSRAANKMGLIRLKAPGAARARIAIGLDILATDVPLYQLDPQGFPMRDNTGALIETGEVTAGYIIRPVKMVIPPATNFGALQPVAGSMNDGETQSQIYPFVELKAAHEGEPGNLTGFRLYAASELTASPVDTQLVEDQRSVMYRMQVIYKPTAKSSPMTWETLSSAQEVQFALNPEAVNEAFDTELFADDILLKAYRDMNFNANGVRTYGPFEAIHFYHNHIQTISQMVQATESVFGTLSDDEEDIFLVNVVDFKYTNGAPYQSVQLQGVLDGALELSELATHYLEGGAAGAMTPENYEQAVLDQLLTFGEGAIKWRNIAKYPAHQFYDTGFSLPVKNVIPRITAVRSNMVVYLATHIAGLPQQTLDEESSLAVALNAKMQAYPESVIFGTTFMRGVIVAGSGNLVDPDSGSELKYRDFCPGTIDLAFKKGRYQGAAAGAWVGEYAYDNGETGGNQVSCLTNLNNTYRPDDVRNKDWANGVVYWQDSDRMVAFYPGIQTAYSNDTSPLNSEMVVTAIAYLTTVTFNVWKALTGNQKLTRNQLIERSNELILAQTKDRFDGRFVIIPETLITDDDNALGYSWSCNVHIYAENMPTVFAAAVIAHRMEDLNG